MPLNPDKATTWLGIIGGVLTTGSTTGFNIPSTKQELGGWAFGLTIALLGYLTNKK